MKTPITKSAWLITWDEPGRHQIAGIYPSSWGTDRIKELMRAIYIAEHYMPHEQFFFARHAREMPAARAVVRNEVRLDDDLVIWDAGPALHGRRVKALSVTLNTDQGEEVTTWTELPPLEWDDKERGTVKRQGEGASRRVVRKIGWPGSGEG